MNIGMGGNLSGGKTAFAVWLTVHSDPDKRIISNIWLDIPGREVFLIKNSDLIEFLIENYENQEKLFSFFGNSVLLLDEITNLINARRSGANINEIFTTFLMMCGKLDCDVLFTYQILESQVDKRLREITNVYAHCQRIDAETGMPMFFMPRITSKKVLIRVLLEFNLEVYGIVQKQFVFDPSTVFSLYNTREIVLLDRSRYLKPTYGSYRRG